MPFITPKDSSRLQTALALLSDYSKLSVPAITQHLSQNFTHEILPSSLSIPKRNLTEFEGHAGRITSLFKSFSMTPNIVYEDSQNNAVVAMCTMSGELVLGEKSEDWENECVLLMGFDQGGKIEVLREFVDSAKANMLHAKVMKAMEGMGNVLKD